MTMKNRADRAARVAASLQSGNGKISFASAARARRIAQGLRCGAAIPAGRCERSTGGAESDVEFQLSAALHRRRDFQNTEIASYRPGSSPADPVEHFTIGNVGFYNNIGRTEVIPYRPIPMRSRRESAIDSARTRFSNRRNFGDSALSVTAILIRKSKDNSWMYNRGFATCGPGRPPANSRIS